MPDVFCCECDQKLGPYGTDHKDPFECIRFLSSEIRDMKNELRRIRDAIEVVKGQTLEGALK